MIVAGDILGATELKGPVNYKYNDLKAATKKFSAENKLGEGGFGDVYKVNLCCIFQNKNTLAQIYPKPEENTVSLFSHTNYF